MLAARRAKRKFCRFDTSGMAIPVAAVFGSQPRRRDILVRGRQSKELGLKGLLLTCLAGCAVKRRAPTKGERRYDKAYQSDAHGHFPIDSRFGDKLFHSRVRWTTQKRDWVLKL